MSSNNSPDKIECPKCGGARVKTVSTRYTHEYRTQPGSVKAKPVHVSTEIVYACESCGQEWSVSSREKQ